MNQQLKQLLERELGPGQPENRDTSEYVQICLKPSQALGVIYLILSVVPEDGGCGLVYDWAWASPIDPRGYRSRLTLFMWANIGLTSGPYNVAKHDIT